MKIEVSTVIDRAPAVVFEFVATNQVHDHPRWDPTMIELEQLTAGPIGVGAVLRRVTSRGAGPVEGTMEFVEWEPGQAMATVIHDGSLEMRSRVSHRVAGTSGRLSWPTRFDSSPWLLRARRTAVGWRLAVLRLHARARV